MSLPTSRAAYEDYYAIWDRALADPSGIRVRCESFDSAVYHRTRLHMSRSIHKNDSHELYPDPADPRHGVSPYDRYMVTIRPADGNDFYLLITPRTLGIIGQIESLTGTEYEPQWNTPALEHETPPQLTSPTGTKLLPPRSDSTSEAPIAPDLSPDSTTPESSPPTHVLRRL